VIGKIHERLRDALTVAGPTWQETAGTEDHSTTEIVDLSKRAHHKADSRDVHGKNPDRTDKA